MLRIFRIYFVIAVRVSLLCSMLTIAGCKDEPTQTIEGTLPDEQVLPDSSIVKAYPAVQSDSLPVLKLESFTKRTGGRFDFYLDLGTRHHGWRDDTGEWRSGITMNIDSILVFRRSDHTWVQTIYPKVEDFEPSYGSGVMNFEDVNFDGNTDFRILSHAYMYSSEEAFWIFDTLQEKFFRDTINGLDQMENVEVLPHLQALHSGSHSGLTYFYHSLYQWRGSKLVCVGKEEEMDWSDDHVEYFCEGLGKNGWGKDTAALLPFNYNEPGNLLKFLR